MADRPIYYGGNSPKLYGSGGKSPMYYGGKPAYGGYGGYGGGSYGGYGGSYGSYGGYGYGAYGGVYGGTEGSGGEGSSVVGTLTLSRVLRVLSQRWLSIFVFLLIGLIVAFAVYRISPTIYEATSEFTMDMRRSTGGSHANSAIAEVTPDYGNSYAEIFNTRISDWRSDKVITKVVQFYRAGHPSSTVADEEIIGCLGGSQLELVRNSRIITITVRSKNPSLCAALANSYAQSIEAFTDEENKLRCDKAVAQIHANVDRKNREVEKLAKQIIEFRTANHVDTLRSQQDTLQQGLLKTTGDILALETEETQLVEWEKMLAQVQKDPQTYGNLSTGVPRAQEIATEFRAYQDAQGKCQKLEFTYTENHPEVISAKKELEISKQRFLDAAARALLTGRSTLRVTRNQLTNLKQKQTDLRAELASVGQRIVLAESGLNNLEQETAVSRDVLKGLIMDENKARIEAEGNNEIVRVGRPAGIPSVPVLPNPTIIFGAGVFLALALGVLFVLVIDNLEDTVVNLSDIEGRLSLKVLAVLPHVRSNKREDVAKHLIGDMYSQFSESVAGLRNLFDSPRYEALTHCLLVISTQPGEGKTITSTSIAISYAQAGRKVLHVDFDLRRPRLAHVWGVDVDREHSFSHALQAAGREKPDFAKLVYPSKLQPGLDVICSMPPEDVAPAMIFGSSVVPEFFEWARANYDHVIVDSPPFGIVGDVVSLAVQVDAVVIMCCPDRTRFKPIQYCSWSLTEAGANVLGVVVNDIEVSSAGAFAPHTKGRHGGHYGYGYGYGYGYRYGYGYGYRPKEKANEEKVKGKGEGEEKVKGKGEGEEKVKGKGEGEEKAKVRGEGEGAEGGSVDAASRRVDGEPVNDKSKAQEKPSADASAKKERKVYRDEE